MLCNTYDFDDLGRRLCPASAKRVGLGSSDNKRVGLGSSDNGPFMFRLTCSWRWWCLSLFFFVLLCWLLVVVCFVGCWLLFVGSWFLALVVVIICFMLQCVVRSMLVLMKILMDTFWRTLIVSRLIIFQHELKPIDIVPIILNMNKYDTLKKAHPLWIGVPPDMSHPIYPVASMDWTEAKEKGILDELQTA